MPPNIHGIGWPRETLSPCPVSILPRKAKPCINLQDACGCQHMQCICCPEPQATIPASPDVPDALAAFPQGLKVYSIHCHWGWPSAIAVAASTDSSQANGCIPIP